MRNSTLEYAGLAVMATLTVIATLALARSPRVPAAPVATAAVAAPIKTLTVKQWTKEEFEATRAQRRAERARLEKHVVKDDSHILFHGGTGTPFKITLDGQGRGHITGALSVWDRTDTKYVYLVVLRNTETGARVWRARFDDLAASVPAGAVDEVQMPLDQFVEMDLPAGEYGAEVTLLRLSIPDLDIVEARKIRAAAERFIVNVL